MTIKLLKRSKLRESKNRASKGRRKNKAQTLQYLDLKLRVPKTLKSNELYMTLYFRD